MVTMGTVTANGHGNGHGTKEIGAGTGARRAQE